MKILLGITLLALSFTAHAQVLPTDYETVAVSQSSQTLGPAGGQGDILETLVIVPATTSPGAVQITDGSLSPVTVFVGGASSVNELRPILLRINARSTSGAWKVTTGLNVSAIGVGRFK
jgi:hypothetical protein